MFLDALTLKIFLEKLQQALTWQEKTGRTCDINIAEVGAII